MVEEDEASLMESFRLHPKSHPCSSEFMPMNNRLFFDMKCRGQ